jgi:hypothetical protein
MARQNLVAQPALYCCSRLKLPQAWPEGRCRQFAFIGTPHGDTDHRKLKKLRCQVPQVDITELSDFLTKLKNFGVRSRKWTSLNFFVF